MFFDPPTTLIKGVNATPLIKGVWVVREFLRRAKNVKNRQKRFATVFDSFRQFSRSTAFLALLGGSESCKLSGVGDRGAQKSGIMFGCRNFEADLSDFVLPENPYPPNLGGDDSPPQFGG